MKGLSGFGKYRLLVNGQSNRDAQNGAHTLSTLVLGGWLSACPARVVRPTVAWEGS